MAAALHGTATARFEGRAKVHREIQPAAVADSSLQPQRCAKLRTDRLGRIQQLHPQRRPSAIAAAAAAEEKAALRPYRLASVEFRADRNYFPFSRRGKFAYRRVGRGAVAQLGERRNGIAKVRGSIPLGSTIQAENLLVFCDSVGWLQSRSHISVPHESALQWDLLLPEWTRYSSSAGSPESGWC